MTLRAALVAAGLDYELTPAQQAALLRFFELRDHWQRTHNVAGPATTRAPYSTDVVDAVAVHVAAAPNTTLVDVGAGSGVPGFLVAILDPTRRVVLVEPLAKRTAFLRHARQTIDMPNLQVVRGRWPVAVPGAFQIVSRAVVSPAEWPALATAGAAPRSVLRMLARLRPAWPMSTYSLSASVDYSRSGAAARVERWDLTAPASS